MLRFRDPFVIRPTPQVGSVNSCWIVEKTRPALSTGMQLRHKQSMKNISDTEAYTLYDHIFSGTARALSRVIGLKRITQPFWARWLASGVDEETVFSFLDGVGTIDDWASTASKVVDRKVAEYELRKGKELSKEENVEALRRLSYLCHMAQWGCLPLNDTRRRHYRMARDFYLAAETLAFGDRFKRIEIPWKGQTLFGHLHLQRTPAPLIVIIHGIDGCKEEHLATELSLYENGFNTLGFDGPGQGEALILSSIMWGKEFHQSISEALTSAQQCAASPFTSVGVVGISIGGMWVLECAAKDSRIKAIFDLGAPIHTRRFTTLPFLIKTRMCQVTGAKTQSEIQAVLGQNNIESPELLTGIHASVRMMHGRRDRVVSVADKEWLLQKLGGPMEARTGSGRELTLRVIEDGDHCCTGHADSVRQDIVAFFKRTLFDVQ
jgi:esterase/lipase